MREKKGKKAASQVDLDEFDDDDLMEDPEYRKAFAEFSQELGDMDFAQLTEESNKKLRKKKGKAEKRLVSCFLT